MCDPVPFTPASNYSCVQCGSQVEYEGNLLCDRCKRGASPALTPTGAAPSTSTVDPGLQSDRWEFKHPPSSRLARQQVSLRKVGQPLDPKDLKIEVTYDAGVVKVYLEHRPTGLNCQELGPADQKEAIHSRLYGELKERVGNSQQVLAERMGQAVAGKPSSLTPVPIHLGLHPSTRSLVASFAEAMAEKLYSAQQKYGYSDGWMNSQFIPECRQHLREHLEKGDPRDVANYCAFLWWHKASTVSAVAEARTVPEPLPARAAALACQPVAGQAVAYEFEENTHPDRIETLWEKKIEYHFRPDSFRPGSVRNVRALVYADATPAPEQPSSQVHPDPALPSRRSE